MADRKPIDWEAIEPDWRAGVKSVLQIAADYEKSHGRKISHTAINKHFRELGIPRDLKEKVRAKAESIVAQALVSAQVSTETKPSDATIINDAGAVVASVMLSQRRDVQRSRRLVMLMLDELEHQTENRELFEELGILLRSPDDKGMDRLNDIYMKAMSLPSRSGVMKQLSDALKTLIALERQAFNIDDGQGVGDDDKVIKRIERVIVDVTPKQ